MPIVDHFVTSSHFLNGGRLLSSLLVPGFVEVHIVCCKLTDVSVKLLEAYTAFRWQIFDDINARCKAVALKSVARLMTFLKEEN
jgi:hypothetical protein